MLKRSKYWAGGGGTNRTSATKEVGAECPYLCLKCHRIALDIVPWAAMDRDELRPEADSTLQLHVGNLTSIRKHLQSAFPFIIRMFLKQIAKYRMNRI